MPLISIMLPAKDAAATVRAAAESCLQQTKRDLELLLIENDSTAKTIAVMEQLARSDARVRIVHAPPGVGFIAALNLGWRQSQGEFLARMDADDISYPQRIEKQLQLLNEHPELAACGTAVRIVRRGDHGKILPPLQGFADYQEWLNSVTSPESIAAERFIDSPISNPSAMIRRRVFDQIGGYQVVDWAEDYDFWLRLMENDLLVGKVPEILLDWIDSDSRMTRNDAHYSQRQFLNAKAHFLARLPIVRDAGVEICGAGPIGKRLARLLEIEGVAVTAFYEVSDRKIGNVIGGIPVRGSNDMPRCGKCVMVSAIGVKGGRARVRKLMRPLGYREGIDFFCVA
ncbi:MAG: glycosyltransferase involved in cell wall biosynthesis [Verrucomicrobiales bacterium]|jgi:glycosyltransferase involved in cell wall biosynthesis